MLYLYEEYLAKMAVNNEEIVSSLRDKIVTVISLLEKSRKENAGLRQENDYLRDDLKDKIEKTRELEDKIETLKIAKTVVASSEDSHDAKIKINRIVREIDKCIALLNK